MSKSPYDKYPPFGEEYPHKVPDWYKTKEPPKAKPATLLDLFPNLERLSIGWSPLLSDLKSVTTAKPSYPPYDIVTLDGDDAKPYDGVTILRVAVAGFTKDELNVVVQDSKLTISGKQKKEQKGEVVYQGIAARDFELKLAIAEHWQIFDTYVDAGMLTIKFGKDYPEDRKPRQLEIGDGPKYKK